MTEEHVPTDEDNAADPPVEEQRPAPRWEPLPWRRIGIGLGALAIIAVIVIFAVPIMGVTWAENEPYAANETYSETEPYTVTETYYESEPYAATETYYVREPYTVTQYYWTSEPYTTWEDIAYRVTDSGRDNWFWQNNTTYWVTIQNADTKSGYFQITFNLVTSGGATKTVSASQYIAIADEVRVERVHYGDYLSSFTYTVDPPTKEVIKTRQVQETRDVIEYGDVQKTRPVTKYRDVAKTREVTKYRDVEKTREVTLFREVERNDRVTVFEYLTEW